MSALAEPHGPGSVSRSNRITPVILDDRAQALVAKPQRPPTPLIALAPFRASNCTATDGIRHRHPVSRCVQGGMLPSRTGGEGATRRSGTICCRPLAEAAIGEMHRQMMIVAVRARRTASGAVPHSACSRRECVLRVTIDFRHGALHRPPNYG